MQTQCPHCETRFRVTETQVNAADGFVRCSVCEEVFNAFEVAQQDEHQQSLLDQQALHESSSNEETERAEANPELDASHINEQLEQTEDDTAQNDIDETVEEPAASETSDDDIRKDTFDFFAEDDDESSSHVVPEQFKKSYADGSGSFIGNLLWGIGALLLTATLGIEYAWFNRDQLNQIPQLQPWTERLCQYVECKDIAMRNPAKIKLVARNVYSHPNEKNALMVDITMKNQADFAQPYPVMQIKFSDVRGGDVAARRFLPDEYLPADIRDRRQRADSQQALFEPDTNMSFTIEIQDPGKQAMTYEFDFL